MDDIAAEVRLHRTTGYSYFPTKDAELVGVFVREMDLVLRAADPVLNSDDPFDECFIMATSLVVLC